MNKQEEKNEKNIHDLKVTVYYIGGMAAVVAHMTLMGWMIVSM